jgi:NDP-sugar pyrophosphorylase family protein
MSKYNYKVLITTSGIGSRLGELTKTTNKALVKVAGKPALSYILDSYPSDMEFVITIGYLKEQVVEFIKHKYPQLNVTFAEVDKFDGPGTSMGYSMLQARKFLSCPFIIQCNDTLVFEPIPDPSVENWNAGTRGPSTQAYTSFKILNEHSISKIADKGATEYDLLHIGFVGIKDHELYWNCLAELYENNPNDSVLNDTRTMNVMLERGAKFKPVEYKLWLDIGNPKALEETEKYLLAHPVLLNKR